MSQPTPIKKSFSIPIPELDDSPVQTPTSKSKYQVQISPRGQTFIPILPLYGNLPRISGNTLVSIISGEYSDHFDNLYIIDCRYDYEYNGGHIISAINLLERRQLKTIYNSNVLLQQKEKMLHEISINRDLEENYIENSNIEKSVR